MPIFHVVAFAILVPKIERRPR